MYFDRENRIITEAVCAALLALWQLPASILAGMLLHFFAEAIILPLSLEVAIWCMLTSMSALGFFVIGGVIGSTLQRRAAVDCAICEALMDNNVFMEIFEPVDIRNDKAQKIMMAVSGVIILVLALGQFSTYVLAWCLVIAAILLILAVILTILIVLPVLWNCHKMIKANLDAEIIMSLTKNNGSVVKAKSLVKDARRLH